MTKWTNYAYECAIPSHARREKKDDTNLSSLNDAGGQQLLCHVLILEQDRVVLHVGPDTQNVLHLWTSDSTEG